MSNTYNDFLATINKKKNAYISCPACGSPMGLRYGGYEMIASESLQEELNNQIAALRVFCEKIEQTLEQRNEPLDRLKIGGSYPYRQEKSSYSDLNLDDEDEVDDEDDVKFNDRTLTNEGNYRGVIGEDAAKEFVGKNLDFFEDNDFLEKFPLQNEKDNELLYRRCLSLVTGLEPRSLNGPVGHLILSQKDVFVWRKKLSSDSGKQSLYTLLKSVCPTIQGYLVKLEELHLKRKEDEKIPRAILRVQLLLALILGHKVDNPQDFGLDTIGVKKNIRYTFPKLTVISYKNLLGLLNSEVVLGNVNLNLSEGFSEELKVSKIQAQRDTSTAQGANKAEPEAIYLQRLGTLVAKWGTEVNKLVYFSCKGLVGKDLSRCGWHPKEGKTHSIILLGSRGTGKSSVMLTGLVAFRRYCQCIGATLAFDMPDDREKMLRLEEMYQNNEKPGRTLPGDKTSVKLSLRFPETDSLARTHFVFTDIPGEEFERSLKSGGSQSWVLKILKSSETVIFFFDLFMESSIREIIAKSRNSGGWEKALKSYDFVKENRKEPASDGSKKTVQTQQSTSDEEKAFVPQLDLLEQLVTDLQKQRNGKLDGINFVCVIPKADLYADKEDAETKFLTAFYNLLEKERLLSKSEFEKVDEESFDSLCSVGGIGSKFFKDDKVVGVNRAAIQKEIGHFISDAAKSGLINIKNSLGEDGIPAFKLTLQDLIKIRLIANIEATFGKDNVYFLPVSGLGRDTSSLLADDGKRTETGNILTDRPFNQKLSEYVFLLPVSLAVIDDQNVSKPKSP